MARQRSRAVPVIDLFAGPGGLGEGFSAFQATDGKRAFKIHLSIEKDPTAHETLGVAMPGRAVALSLAVGR